MKLAVVINGSAGALLDQSSDAAAARIENLFRDRGATATVTVAPPGGLMETLRAAVATDADAVVVGGGDGTVAAAATLLVDTDKAMGVLPLGTANLLAKDLHMALDLEAAVGQLAQGEIRAVDVAEVNGTVFLCNAVLGLFPMLARYRERHRHEPGFAKWLHLGAATLAAMRRYPRLEMEIDLGSGPQRRRTMALAVANNAYDDAFFSFFARSNLGAGELAVYLARHKTSFGMFRMATRMLLGRWQSDRDLSVERVREVTVRAPKRSLAVAIDGEVHRVATPLRFRMRPGALKVLVPAGALP